MAGNLASLIPAVFTGPNGERLTPDQIKRRQEIAQSLLAQATDTSPNAGGMTSILAKGVQGLAAGWREGQADRAGQANAAASRTNIASLLGGLVGGSPAASTALPAASSTGVGAEMAATAPGGAGATTGTGILPPTFLAAVDGSEGAGAYDTLFGHAQRSGPFAGTDVSSMPIRDVLAFADPSGPYGQHVKGKVGRVATPMGRYQIVGTTLRNAVGELGLDPNTPFDAATQDRVALHLAKRRISSADTLDGKISALRSEWEGFRSVPNDQMRQIVAELEASGDAPPMATTGPVAGTPQGATEAVAPAAGGQPPAFDAGRFGDPINLAEMPPSASTLPSSLIDQGSSYAPAPPMTVPPREVGSMRVAEALAAQPVTSAPAMAPAMPQQMPQPAAPTLPPINPAVIETLSSPYASPEEKSVAQALLGDYQKKQQAMQERALKEQQRQMEIQRRQQIAQQTGIDPSYAMDDEIWKGAAGNLFAPPSTSTVNGAVIDNRTGKPIYQAPAQNYRQVYGEEAARMGLDPSKAYNIGPDGKIAPIGDGGVTVNNNTGGDKFGEEFAKLDAKALSTVADSGLAAQRNLGRIDQLEGLLKESPTGFTAAAAQRAGEWGIPTEGLDSIQAAQAAINSLVPEQRQPGSGPMSDTDLALFKQSLPRIINQPGGNERIIQTMRGIAQYDAQGAQIVQQLRNGEISRAEAFQQLQSRPNPLSDFKAPGRDENPLPPQPNGRKTSTGATWEIID